MAEISGNIGTVAVSVEVDMVASEQFDKIANMLGYFKGSTCNIVDHSNEGPHAEDVMYHLSCGHYEIGSKPKYCPECGAKVVE